MTPHVFYRLTDNWLELTVRFVVPTHDIRFIKNAISRAILRAFDEAKIGVASATYDIVGLPPLRIDEASLRRLARIARSDSGVSSGA